MWLLEKVSEIVTSASTRLLNARSGLSRPADVIDRTCYSHSLLRAPLTSLSVTEEKENPLYAGVLNTLSNHCVGTVPLPVCLTKRDNLNDAVEDEWMSWAIHNQIGSALREFRRKAASTGLAVMLPVAKSDTECEVKLAYKVFGRDELTSPLYDPDLLIEDGVEFKNNEIVAVYILEDGEMEPTRYSTIRVDDTPVPAIVWSRKRIVDRWPECAPAFAIYPSIRRFMDNIIASEESKTAIPMFMELDGSFYKPNTSLGTPTGQFKYQPGMIPTIPPGAKISAFNTAAVAADRTTFLNLMATVSARCIDCPANLALGDSSNHNMSSSMTDLQPWKYAVDIDRFDFEIVVRKVFNQWYDMAQLVPNMIPVSSFSYPRLPVLFNYTVLFNHPDPVKCASSRAQDLISGASTLTRIYADQGRNARRELRKEARMLKMPIEKLYELILTSRSKVAYQVLNGNQETPNQVQQAS